MISERESQIPLPGEAGITVPSGIVGVFAGAPGTRVLVGSGIVAVGPTTINVGLGVGVAVGNGSHSNDPN